jgi:hypothetical protein
MSNLTTALAIAIFALFGAALVARIVIFKTMNSDPAAKELLDDHFPVQKDFLFWRLWRLRSKVAQGHRWKIEVYFWLTIAIALTLLITLISKGA